MRVKQVTVIEKSLMLFDCLYSYEIMSPKSIMQGSVFQQNTSILKCCVFNAAQYNKQVSGIGRIENPAERTMCVKHSTRPTVLTSNGEQFEYKTAPRICTRLMMSNQHTGLLSFHTIFKKSAGLTLISFAFY